MLSDRDYNLKPIMDSDPRDFLLEKSVREKIILNSSLDKIKADFESNRLVDLIHPKIQYCTVSEIIDHGFAKSYILIPNRKKGCNKLSLFRAGQHVCVYLDIDGAKVTRPYSISSSPNNSFYRITIKFKENGFASKYILSKWVIGTSVLLSSPRGDFYYTNLRDLNNVVALAGGSGINPFISMANSILDDKEDFNLTIIYGCRYYKDVLHLEELRNLENSSNGRISLNIVLSDEKKDGYYNGLITASLINQVVTYSNFSVFVCGPQKMCNFIRLELNNMNLPRRLQRFDILSDFDIEELPSPSTVKITLLVRNKECIIECKTNQTVLDAIEKSGIRIPSDCRGGECSLCRSRLISGNVYIPRNRESRRYSDIKYNWIHPCVSFPMEDLVIEVFPDFSV